MRLRISLKQLLILIALICVGLGGYLVWAYDSIKITAPDITEFSTLYHDRKTISLSGITGTPDELEPVCSVAGNLQQNTRVVCALYEIRDGFPSQRSGFATGRNPAFKDQPWREEVELLLVLNQTELEGTKTVQLGCSGGQWWGGAERKLKIDFDLTHSRTFTATLREGQNVIAYAAGDTKLELGIHNSVDDFAAANKQGNFIVVWIGLSKAPN